MPRRKQFGPYMQTPQSTIMDIENGIEIYPSAIDSIPLDIQSEYEDVRGTIIRRKLFKRNNHHDQNVPDWSWNTNRIG